MTRHDDPHDDHRVALLRLAADAVPVGPLQADAMITAARERRRRRRGAVLAAAAVVVVAVGTAAVGLTREAPGRTPDRTSASPPASTATDTRLVGVGRLALEVPASWPVDPVPCGGPVGPACDPEGRGPRVVLLTHSPLHIGGGFRPGGVLEPMTVPGGTVQVSHESRTAGGLVSMVFTTGDDGLVIVTSTSEAETRRVVGTVRLLGADEVAVPFTVDDMRSAGLRVSVDEGVEAQGGDLVAESEPAGGAVVPTGSTVTVLAVRERPSWPPWPMGPQMSCRLHFPDDLPEGGGAVAGTVTAVEVGGYDQQLEGRAATLVVEVEEWLRGEGGSTVRLRTVLPALPDDPQDAVGTRILAAFGPERELMPCGFTRPWRDDTARRWRGPFS